MSPGLVEQAPCYVKNGIQNLQSSHLLQGVPRRFNSVVRSYGLALDVPAEEYLQIVVDLVAIDPQQNERRKLMDDEPGLLGQFAARGVLQRFACFDTPAWKCIEASRRGAAAPDEQHLIAAQQGDRNGEQDGFGRHGVQGGFLQRSLNGRA